MQCIQWYKRKGWKKIEGRFVDSFLEKVEGDDSEQKHVEATEH